MKLSLLSTSGLPIKVDWRGFYVVFEVEYLWNNGSKRVVSTTIQSDAIGLT